MKKLISIIVTISLCLSLSVPVLAYESIIENGTEDNQYKLIEYNGTVFYTYEDEYIVYVSQISEDGTMQFSYAMRNDDVIFSSDAFYVSDFYNSIGEIAD